MNFFFPFYLVRKSLKDDLYYLTFSKFIKEKFGKSIPLEKDMYKRAGNLFEDMKLIEEAIFLFRKSENFDGLENLIKKNVEKIIFT